MVAVAAVRVRTQAPLGLTDAEFWDIFSSMSEPGGSFLSENFVSNETGFQEVIPTLQRTLTHDGVYLGVGPEQNYTYIANLKPRMAVIFDIRRQNAMQHLMYKAIFEQSPTRADFIERLFSRPMVRLGPAAKIAEVFDTVTAAAPSDSAYRANLDAIVRTLKDTHGFALSLDDIASITNLYRVFYEAGPGINYGYRQGMAGSIRGMYPTFGTLQAATNADSVPMAFLASDENYRVVRDLHMRNLIVPVVGDFAGPKAIRDVGAYLSKRGLTVTAFYLSNVEQYLFRDAGAADRFYGNVASLPTDTTSTLIRSVPGTGSFGPTFFGPGSTLRFAVPNGGALPGNSWAGPGSFSITIVDSGGRRLIRTVQDSAGTPVVRVMQDSAGQTVTRRADSTLIAGNRQDSVAANTLRALMAGRDSMLRQFMPGGPAGAAPTIVTRGGALLNSGLATTRATLEAFFAGKLTTYQDVIAMTKTSGWK